MVGATARAPHLPAGAPERVRGLLRPERAHRSLASSQDQSLLELAEACDVPVRWSCRTGVCHNCESGLISGAVDYKPDPLDPPAEGNVLICCCPAEG